MEIPAIKALPAIHQIGSSHRKRKSVMKQVIGLNLVRVRPLLWFVRSLPGSRVWARAREAMRPRRQRSIIRVAACCALSAALAGCSLLGLGAQTPQERAQYLEPMLSAAGFHMVPAATPEKVRHLKKLLALKVSYYTGKDGELHYWFADPDYCHCLYQGSEKAYQKYQNLRVRARLAKQEQEAAEENYEASQDMQMNMMDPFYGGFGMGPGMGFGF